MSISSVNIYFLEAYPKLQNQSRFYDYISPSSYAALALDQFLAGCSVLHLGFFIS